MTGTVLALALAGHLIGDWIVQTDAQAAGKVWPSARWVAYQKGRGITGHKVVDRHDREIRRRERVRSWKANQQHMLGYHLTMAALVAPAWHDRWALIALAVSWVTHSFIDHRWPVRWLMRHTGSGPFSETTFGVIAVDQALHLSILCCLVAWLA